MKTVSIGTIDGMCAAAGIPDEHKDRLVKNAYNLVTHKNVEKWYKIKDALKKEGYTHLPNGDDL